MPLIRQNLTFDLRRFWLFAYHKHDAVGGMNDFYDSYHTEKEAREAIKDASGDSFQIVDTVTGVATEYC